MDDASRRLGIKVNVSHEPTVDELRAMCERSGLSIVVGRRGALDKQLCMTKRGGGNGGAVSGRPGPGRCV